MKQTMLDPGTLLTERLNAALLRHPTISSERGLAEATGINASYIHKILAGHFAKREKSGPNAFFVRLLAKALGTTTNALLRVDEPPDPRELSEIYVQSGRRIEAFAHVIEYSDTYKKPRNGFTFIERAGSKSLLARQTGTTSADLLQLEFVQFNATTRRRVTEAQRLAWDVGNMTTIGSIPRHKSNLAGKTVNIHYLRSSFRVKTQTGRERMLIFCSEIYPVGERP